MKVLFIHSNIPVYVSDALFHGLRELLGNDCVDVPRNDPLYKPLSQEAKYKTGSKGNTLYGLLEDNSELQGKRVFWQVDLQKYDLIIFADIRHSWSMYWEICRQIRNQVVVIIDGDDYAAMFPFVQMNDRLKYKPWSFFTPVRSAKYFKREIGSGVESYGLANYLPKFMHRFFRVPRNVYPLGMSIPACKITQVSIADKVKTFVDYIVDKDVAEALTDKHFCETGAWKPLFDNEYDYYQDIQKSRFGITTKREGWDCLRHYEYAANGAILCFKNLKDKPALCSPLGLNNSNFIEYSSYPELMQIINALTDQEYEHMLSNGYKWIQSNTTLHRAKNFLNDVTL